MTDSKRLDLFSDCRDNGRKHGLQKQRRYTPPSRSYFDLMPWAKVSPNGNSHVDFVETEEMYTALLGSAWGELGDRLKGIFADELTGGRMAMRIYEMRTASPMPVPGALHLSGREAQRARNCLRRTSAHGELLPWTASIFRHPVTEPLQHGELKMTQGIHMASLSRRHRVMDWRRPVPLLLGASTAEATWAHLCGASASIAVWSGTRLYLFRQVEGRFPTLLESLGHPSPLPQSPFDANSRGLPSSIADQRPRRSSGGQHEDTKEPTEGTNE